MSVPSARRDVFIDNSSSPGLIREQFRALDLKEMASIMVCPVLVDLRNIYSPEEAMRNGFHYCGVGRPKSLAY